MFAQFDLFTKLFLSFIVAFLDIEQTTEMFFLKHIDENLLSWHFFQSNVEVFTWMRMNSDVIFIWFGWQGEGHSTLSDLWEQSTLGTALIRFPR